MSDLSPTLSASLGEPAGARARGQQLRAARLALVKLVGASVLFALVGAGAVQLGFWLRAPPMAADVQSSRAGQ